MNICVNCSNFDWQDYKCQIGECTIELFLKKLYAVFTDLERLIFHQNFSCKNYVDENKKT